MAPLVVAVFWVLLGGASVGAQPVLALRMDTSPLGAPRDAAMQKRGVEGMLQWLALDQLLRDPIAEGVLRECLAQAAAAGDRLSLDVPHASQAHQGEAIRYRALLTIRAPEPMAAYIAILDGRLANVPVSQISVAGIKAAEHRDTSWPAWRSLDVLRRDGVLLVGLGEGRAAIEGSFADPQDETALDRHRDALGPRVGTAVLECYLDLNRVRVSFPDLFGDDPAGRFLAACHLANARSCMLHVRSSGAPGRLAIDATWSLRSEPDELIRRLSIASFAPDAAPKPDPLAIVHPDAARWVAGGLDAYAALLGAEERRAFERQRRAWVSRRLPLAGRLQASLAPDATLRLDRGASGLTLGAWTVRWPLREGARPADVSRAVRALLDPWEKDIAPDTSGLAGRLAFPPGSLVRGIEWSVETDALDLRIDTTPDGAWLLRSPR